MRTFIGLFFLLSLSLGASGVADPRDRATADRAVKLRGDCKSLLAIVGPKLGLSADETQNIQENLDSMVPREGLLGGWRKSNRALSAVGIISKEDLPDMLEMREGILIIEKAPKGENISLTAFYASEVTDEDTEKESVKDSKDVGRNSGWAYRFVMRSRLIGGFNNDVSTVKPVFILKYSDQIPICLRIYNDSMVYIMGDCKVDKLEIVARDNGLFGCDNLMVEELIVDQRDQTQVELKGTAESMDAVVDDQAILLAGDLRAKVINMNLSRNDCNKVVVNPQERLIKIGKIRTGTFESKNSKAAEEDGSVVWRNIKNMGGRAEKAVTRPMKALIFGTGYLTWKIITLPFKFLGALGKRLANARVGVGGSVGVGPVRVGAGVMI